MNEAVAIKECFLTLVLMFLNILENDEKIRFKLLRRGGVMSPVISVCLSVSLERPLLMFLKLSVIHCRLREGQQTSMILPLVC